MNDFEELVELLKTSVLFVVISVTGGVTRLIWEGPGSTARAVSSVAVAAFSGLLVFFLATWFDFPVSAKAALAGVSGFAGVRVLEALQNRLVASLTEGEGDVPDNLKRRRR